MCSRSMFIYHCADGGELISCKAGCMHSRSMLIYHYADGGKLISC